MGPVDVARFLVGAPFMGDSLIIASPRLAGTTGIAVTQSDRSSALVRLFAATLFVSAFLMFLVEPMIARMVLPSLGGAPAVWNTCLVFFQAVLLGGYAYAHGATRLGIRRTSWCTRSCCCCR